MHTYNRIIKSKNSMPIPAADDILFHSKYDPMHEADLFAAQFHNKCNFFIIYGLAGGYHIEALKNKFPDAHFLILESEKNAVSFLKQIPTVSTLLENKNIHIAYTGTAAQALLKYYIPSLYGSITIAELRSWTNFFTKETALLKKEISSALSAISADYSVQSHFGKLWQRNIFLNLKLASKYNCQNNFKDFKFDTNKTAAIIAAGPTLDTSFKKLLSNRNSYTIFATDTSYGALLKRNIIPDVVISIDGQLVSHCHFMNKIDKSILFIFDLCASTSAIRKIINSGAKFCFSESSHPLAVYASKHGNNINSNSFFHLDSGSGTVTIAAASFAQQCGYKKLSFFGADFGYTQKPYTAGTYLDSLYNTCSTRINNSETMYDYLMFRTPLICTADKTKKTTEVLNSYKNTLLSFLEQNNFLHKNDEMYILKNSSIVLQKIENFSYQIFISNYKNNLSSELQNFNQNESTTYPEYVTLLPYIAFLRSKLQDSEKSSFHELLNLAYSKILRYTE